MEEIHSTQSKVSLCQITQRTAYDFDLVLKIARLEQCMGLLLFDSQSSISHR